MAKKKQKSKRTKKKSNKKTTLKEAEKVKDALEISQTVTDVKSFIEKFRADVKKRREGHWSFAQKKEIRNSNSRNQRNFSLLKVYFPISKQK